MTLTVYDSDRFFFSHMGCRNKIHALFSKNQMNKAGGFGMWYLLQKEVRLGKKDLTLKTYLSDPERYADVYKGNVFKGMQVLDGAQLEEV